MNAHKIEVILTEDGTLTLQGLPFHAGEAVEVIILSAKMLQNQADKNLYPLHDTQPYQYDDPTEPVALEDWEVLQ
ncbi:hypothetical protein [Nodularia sp. NIES-3585]|uniref:hypothetical protein n=1 Tax=Nodularia sp. NIES-3585 TaxID=1973477 RepID=UPI000B5C2B12|nr:hypothetical protein [Nodularia sp. NIES-3585]GAX36929.1 hypothetical protein NIES3585_29680 [Nodularia sp. NIES-3585]